MRGEDFAESARMHRLIWDLASYKMSRLSLSELGLCDIFRSTEIYVCGEKKGGVNFKSMIKSHTRRL